MAALPYRNYIFDLYGTLVDIHTDEEDPAHSIMVGNDGLCDIAGAKQAGLATLYVHSNLSPEEPLPPADLVLPAMDMARMGAMLAGGQG